MSQQLESGNVQPNVNPSLQLNHESGDWQPNVEPSLHPNHESGGEQPNVNPFLQPNQESGGVQPNVYHSLKPNHESGGQQPDANPSLQPNRESGGEQPDANPSLQPNHENMPSTSISEESQLSQPQSAGTGERLNYYRPLHIAAQSGDWKSAKSFIDNDPNVLTAQITEGGRTLLHVAAFCWQWGFVLKLLELTSPESCVAQTKSGNTVLHYVAQGGSLKTAKALVQKNRDLLQIGDNHGDLPLFVSISRDSKELIWYLSLLTRVDSPTFPFFRPELPGILRRLIESAHLDIALYFIRSYPNLSIAKDEKENSLLYWLATNPSYFFSGINLGFLESWIYKFVHVDIKNSPTHLEMEDILESILEGLPTLQPRSFATQALRWFKRLIWKTIVQLAPSIKMVRDTKLKHECGVELVNHVCTQLSSMSLEEIKHFLTNPNLILVKIVTGGIEEILRTLFLNFPDLWEVRLMPKRNILQAAIEYRQVKIVNLIKEKRPSGTKNISVQKMELENTTFHLAGKLAPAFKLYSISGAALQMQWELQWFKEVENIIFPYQREWKNTENETAKDVFRKEHKQLADQGEKWMKDTANSCMLVSTLIATVLFAAAFTVPGGNVNDNGMPIFLRTNAFMIFAISDALGLFSSLTSLLMFLAILTARYAQEDFLESLPKKLIMGLGSLFFSIAAMIIAFGAALTIVRSQRWHWVFVPITLLASFPVVIFVMLQLPLFIQMVWSTYGASIFRPWPSRV